MEYQRVAFVANLTRAADVLDRVAAHAAVADLPKQESLEKMQAQVEAGAAIWGAAIAGFLTIPEVVAEVDGLAGSGLTEPDTTRNNGVDCANLFFAVMREFVYPQGEAVAPSYALIEDERWKPTEIEYRMLRKNELRAEATGCRMLAQIITDQPKPDSKGANSANTSRLFSGNIPDNPNLVDLVIRLDAEKSKPEELRRLPNAIARDFTKETAPHDRKAQSLLSAIRRMKREGRVNL